MSAAIVITIPTPVAIKTLVLSVILRLIVSLGPEFTLTMLGFAIVSIMLGFSIVKIVLGFAIVST